MAGQIGRIKQGSTVFDDGMKDKAVESRGRLVGKGRVWVWGTYIE